MPAFQRDVYAEQWARGAQRQVICSTTTLKETALLKRKFSTWLRAAGNGGGLVEHWCRTLATQLQDSNAGSGRSPSGGKRRSVGKKPLRLARQRKQKQGAIL